MSNFMKQEKLEKKLSTQPNGKVWYNLHKPQGNIMSGMLGKPKWYPHTPPEPDVIKVPTTLQGYVQDIKKFFGGIKQIFVRGFKLEDVEKIENTTDIIDSTKEIEKYYAGEHFKKIK